ncbi:MAG TPA: hypothetical protein VGG04_15670 [Candidatus Sulfotelmatobacter sp.]
MKTFEFRGAGDPSLRLKNGCAQDDNALTGTTGDWHFVRAGCAC